MPSVFVGRERELAEPVRIGSAATAGDGAVVLLAGEAGAASSRCERGSPRAAVTRHHDHSGFPSTAGRRPPGAGVVPDRRDRRAAFVAGSDHYRPAGGLGPIGLLGRLIGFVITLAVIAVAVGIFPKVLGQAEPGRLHHLATWFDGRF
jgi:hypothetical protein